MRHQGGQGRRGQAAAKKPGKGQRSDEVEKVKRALVDAYERFADAVERTPGFDGKPVKKVEINKLRDEVKSRGFLETDDNGELTPAARKHFQRAKTDLIESKRFIEADGKFWKFATEPPSWSPIPRVFHVT